MVAIDDADETNGGLEVVSDHFDAVLPTDARGCIEPTVAASLDWLPVAVPAGQHAVVPQPHPAPQRGQPLVDRPRRALYPTYNAASRRRPPGRVLRDEAGRVRPRRSR